MVNGNRAVEIKGSKVLKVEHRKYVFFRESDIRVF